MASKRKKRSGNSRRSKANNAQHPLPNLRKRLEDIRPSADMPAEELVAAQAQAVERLKVLMTAITDAPETVLEMLERLMIPYERVENVPGDTSMDTIVIKLADIEEGENRNTSIASRLYPHLAGQPAPMHAPNPNLLPDQSLTPEARDIITKLRTVGSQIDEQIQEGHA